MVLSENDNFLVLENNNNSTSQKKKCITDKLHGDLNCLFLDHKRPWKMNWATLCVSVKWEAGMKQ